MKTRASCGGFSLVEMMVAATLGALVLALTLTGSILIQRAFAASDFRSTAQNDQLRLSDYLTRDLQPATSVVISRAGQQIDLQNPVGNAPLLQVHLDLPILNGLLGQAPAPSQSIRYTLSGTELYRELNGKRVRLAQNLSSFAAVRTGATVSVSTSFAPPGTNPLSQITQGLTNLRQTVLIRYAQN